MNTSAVNSNLSVTQTILNLTQRQAFVDQPANSGPEIDCGWCKYRILMGKPGTGKSQVLIRVIHEALQREASVLLAAPVALLAQAYRSIFGADLECNTLHAAFRIPVNDGQAFDVNFALNRFDMVVVDEASLVFPASFNMVAATLNCLNCCPVVVIAGDSRQQQPLQTVKGKVSNTVSIVNDHTFTHNAVKHALYQQFRILDKDYEAFVDMVCYMQPTQQQLDQFQSYQAPLFKDYSSASCGEKTTKSTPSLALVMNFALKSSCNVIIISSHLSGQSTGPGKLSNTVIPSLFV